MERFIKADIVVVPFPFSDLSSSKRRPALVVQHFEGNDLLLAQITSKDAKNGFSIRLVQTDYLDGSLNKPSHIRTEKLFTCAKHIISYKACSIKETKMEKVIRTIKRMLEG